MKYSGRTVVSNSCNRSSPSLIPFAPLVLILPNCIC
uniref:Uncharacterized protein n=1 Tax=Parascaris equorum TaxID=6256 RepID=A0A914R3R9_PAREQ